MEELKQEVFYPCYKVMMKHMRLEGVVTAKDFHVYMKLTDKTTQRAETAMLKDGVDVEHSRDAGITNRSPPPATGAGPARHPVEAGMTGVMPARTPIIP